MEKYNHVDPLDADLFNVYARLAEVHRAKPLQSQKTHL
jgi:hypothetical protein